MDAFDADGIDLVIANTKPSGTCADHKAVEPDRVNEGNQGGITQFADAAAFQIVDLNAEQLRQI